MTAVLTPSAMTDMARRQRIESRLDQPRPASDFMARLDAINKLSSSATKRQVDLFGGVRRDSK
jgi:hypothetical protein